MNDIDDLIRNFNNDENVIELKNYYKTLSFMEILGVDRKEKAHSSFLAWLFDSHYNYDLGEKPLMLLLGLLQNQILADDKKNIALRKANIGIEQVTTEYPLKSEQKNGGKNGRVDIYISFTIDKNKYAIVVENKVKSTENVETIDDGQTIHQTDKYYKYFHEQNEQINYIYVFLAPSFNNKRITANNENFINISYDDIVKSVIKPLLSDDNLSNIVRFTLEDYLKTLRKTIRKPNVIDPDSKSISMLSSESDAKENDLIENIRTKHKDLGNRLKLIEENQILHSFREDDLNELIIALAWPEAMTKANKNRTVTFEELDIAPGTTLYLAKAEKKDIKDPRDITVTTMDWKTNVEYELNGEKEYAKISNAAKKLSGKNYGLRGISWFIYNDGKRDINLLKYYEEKK